MNHVSRSKTYLDHGSGIISVLEETQAIDDMGVCYKVASKGIMTRCLASPPRAV